MARLKRKVRRKPHTIMVYKGDARMAKRISSFVEKEMLLKDILRLPEDTAAAIRYPVLELINAQIRKEMGDNGD